MSKIRERIEKRLWQMREDAEFSDDTATQIFTAISQRLAKSGIVVSPEILASAMDDAGEGNYGRAYKFGDKVVKITADASDAKAFIKSRKAQHPNLPRIYDVFKTGTSDEAGSPLWVIVVENITGYPPADYGNAMNAVGEILQNNKKAAKAFYAGADISSLIDVWSRTQDPSEADHVRQISQTPAFTHIVTVLRSLGQIGIRPIDTQEQNWGMRGKEPVLYDLGFAT